MAQENYRRRWWGPPCSVLSTRSRCTVAKPGSAGSVQGPSRNFGPVHSPGGRYSEVLHCDNRIDRACSGACLSVCLCMCEDPGCLGSKSGSSKSNQVGKSFIVVLTFGTSRPGPPVEHLIRAGGSSKHREASSQESQSGPPLHHDGSMTAGGPQICIICSGHTSGCQAVHEVASPGFFSSFWA